MPNPGMSQAVLEAIQRRSQSGQLNQTSPEARMANQAPQPVAPSQVGDKTITSGQAPKPKFSPSNQEEAIVSALIEQLSNVNKAKKEAASVPQSMGGGADTFDYSAGFTQPMSVGQMQAYPLKDYTNSKQSGMSGMSTPSF